MWQIAMHWETQCNRRFKLNRRKLANRAMINTGTTGITKEGKIFRIGGMARSKLPRCRIILVPAEARGKKPDRSHGRVLKNNGLKRNRGKMMRGTPWNPLWINHAGGTHQIRQDPQTT